MPDTNEPHILIVDDDSQVRGSLQQYLLENALRTTAVPNGEQMMQILADDAVDLVVLDLRLPGVDGMSLACSLREHSAIPIIILTGVHDEADRIMGLELGADDYLTKPFSARELLARIRCVLRRTRGEGSSRAQRREVRAYRFADFELNLRTRRLKRRDGRGINLSNGELNLLAALLAAPRKILSRDQILEASRVYDNEVYDRSIDVQVLRLRRKIEADPMQPRLIITQRGIGYCFDSTVEVLF